MKTLISVLLFVLSLVSFPAQAEPSKEWLTQFIAASETARKPDASDKDIEDFLTMLADDFLDVHVQYNVQFEGKESLRKGLYSKRETMISVEESIEDMILGTDTAVIVVNENSSYYKREQIRNFKGRTILVLHFNDNGLVKEMRRYLHQ